MRQAKAQVAITDFYMAFFILILLVATIAYTWNIYINRLNTNLEFDAMKVKAFQITDTLVKSEGAPENWNQNNVRVIGLAESDRRLSEDKVSNFISLTNDEIKSILSIAEYNFFFRLEISRENITKGTATTGAAILSSNIRRYVIYENETAIMEFALWK